MLSFFIEGFSSTEKTGRKVTLVTAHDGKRRRKGREREGAGEREFGVCVWREVLALQLASCHRNHPRTKKWEKWRDTERKRERGRDIEGKRQRLTRKERKRKAGIIDQKDTETYVERERGIERNVRGDRER